MAKKIIRKKKTKEGEPKTKRSIPKEESDKILEEANKVEPKNITLEVARELQQIKAKKKVLEAREKELKARLGDTLTSSGYKDSKGSFLIKTQLDGKDIILKKEARKSVKLNKEKAEDLFREKGVWDLVSETKEVINEDFVEQAVLNGKVSMEELESVTDVKVSYAVLIKDYKPDEEEGVI